MSNTPNVSYIRPEIEQLIPVYDNIKACLKGKRGMIELGTIALPMPNSDDKSVQNKNRYAEYIQRAVFYNVTARTLEGMVGEVVSRDPKVTVPNNMEPITKDANGDGVSIVQQAKKALSMNLAYSRLGLLVDYPQLPEGQEYFTVGQMESLDIRPTIRLFSPYSIINWRHIEIGNKKKLSLVVLAEPWTFYDDGFEMKVGQQIRVLYLDNEGEYCVDIWRPDEPEVWKNQDKVMKGEKKKRESYKVIDGDGKALTEIPFQFVGINDNDANPDRPSLESLAELNIAHFRNSADYEENCFITGQATPWVSGITEDFVKNVWNGNTTLRLGPRGGVVVPENGAFGIEAAPATTMPMEGMTHKEKQMVALGARLIEARKNDRTLGEAEMDRSKELSILASAASNVQSAYNVCLKWCQAFSQSYGGDINFEFTGDFYLSELSSEERVQLMKEWQQGGITWEEYRLKLKKAGIADIENPQEAWNKIKEEQANSLMGGGDNGL